MKKPDYAIFTYQDSTLTDDGKCTFLPTTSELDVNLAQWDSWLQHLEDNVAAYEMGNPRATILILYIADDTRIRVHVDLVRSWIKELQRLINTKWENTNDSIRNH